LKDGVQLGLDFFLRSFKLYAKPHHSLAFFLELLNRSQDFGDQTTTQLNLVFLDLKPNRGTSALGRGDLHLLNQCTAKGEIGDSACGG